MWPCKNDPGLRSTISFILNMMIVKFMAAQESKSMLLPSFLIRDLNGLKSLSCLHKYKYKEINNALASLLCSGDFAVIILPHS